MQIRKAARKQSKIKIAISGPAGSGKTYSALLLAYGLTGTYDNIVVIDTESGSSDLYSDLGDYNVIVLDVPHSPEKYIEAINIAEQANADCIIIDSLSHSWEFLLQYHSKLTGNSFTNWGIVKPRMQRLLQRILDAQCHIICTLRTKTDYIITENKQGKMAPQKVGLKSIQLDGIEYEFTILFELDINHNAISSKDRTQLFSNTESFVISSETGNSILTWCNNGVSIVEIKLLISKASNMAELTAIYNEYKSYYPILESTFQYRKETLNKLLSNSKSSSNGVHN